MMRKILSLLLIIMLVTLPITHAAAETKIQEKCQQAYTKDELKAYIQNHLLAAEREHTVLLVTDQKLTDPGDRCINKNHHHHHQFYKDIELVRMYQVHYKCVDRMWGNKWQVDIHGKMGQVLGGLDISWDDKKKWEEYIKSPCNTYEFSHIYDLDTISDQDLAHLFNLMISVDQYLDRTDGEQIMSKMAVSFAGGATGLADALYTIARAGGRIPYIGGVILVGVGAVFAVSALFDFAESYDIIEVLRDQTIKAVEEMHIPPWGLMDFVESRPYH